MVDYFAGNGGGVVSAEEVSVVLEESVEMVAKKTKSKGLLSTLFGACFGRRVVKSSEAVSRESVSEFSVVESAPSVGKKSFGRRVRHLLKHKKRHEDNTHLKQTVEQTPVNEVPSSADDVEMSLSLPPTPVAATVTLDCATDESSSPFVSSLLATDCSPESLDVPMPADSYPVFNVEILPVPSASTQLSEYDSGLSASDPDSDVGFTDYEDEVNDVSVSCLTLTYNEDWETNGDGDEAEMEEMMAEGLKAAEKEEMMADGLKAEKEEMMTDGLKAEADDAEKQQQSEVEVEVQIESQEITAESSLESRKVEPLEVELEAEKVPDTHEVEVKSAVRITFAGPKRWQRRRQSRYSTAAATRRPILVVSSHTMRLLELAGCVTSDSALCRRYDVLSPAKFPGDTVLLRINRDCRC